MDLIAGVVGAAFGFVLGRLLLAPKDPPPEPPMQVEPRKPSSPVWRNEPDKGRRFLDDGPFGGGLPW